MVNDQNQQTHIASQCCDQTVHPSLKRWLKHSLYLKSSKKLFDPAQRQQIADAIQQAEQGHRGEIQVIIEASLPSELAYATSMSERARQLFAQYRIWDTEYNSGILIYLNLCERTVDIVSDRGIHRAVGQDCWHKICQDMLPLFKTGQFGDGLCLAIAQLGIHLQQFYQQDQQDPMGNELDNQPTLL